MLSGWENRGVSLQRGASAAAITRCAAAAVLWVCAAATAWGQAPAVTALFPPGGQRGTTVAVAASGELGRWPVLVWTDQPGVKVAAEEEQGKLQVEIAADAPPGVCWLRFYNAQGAAALRPFIIGQLPEVEEVEPNDAPGQAQVVELPVTINGRLDKPGDVDSFEVALAAGQTLVASVVANARLGSPADAVLQVCEVVERATSSAAGFPPRVEAFVLEQNHDAIGLDPQIVFTAPRNGRYLVRVFAFPEQPNSSISFSGSDAYVYRLTLTTGGLVDHALPLALEEDAAGEVRLFGFGLDEAGQPAAAGATGGSSTSAPAGATGGSSTSAPAGATGGSSTSAPGSLDAPDRQFEHAFLPGAAGAIALPRVAMPCLVAAGAGSDRPQPVAPPVMISGRLGQPGSFDLFRFSATKGQKFDLRLDSRKLGFPLDAVLVVTDVEGKRLMRVDDVSNQADPSLTFTAPDEGDYLVEVRDLHDRGGLRFVYRLAIEPSRPDFALKLAADSFVLTPGKPLEIAVTVERRAGLAEPIAIRAVGLLDGVEFQGVVSEPEGESSKAVKLVLTASDGASPQSLPFRIEGHVVESNQTRTAVFPLPQPLAGDHHALWLTVQGGGG